MESTSSSSSGSNGVYCIVKVNITGDLYYATLNGVDGSMLFSGSGQLNPAITVNLGNYYPVSIISYSVNLNMTATAINDSGTYNITVTDDNITVNSSSGDYISKGYIAASYSSGYGYSTSVSTPTSNSFGCGISASYLGNSTATISWLQLYSLYSSATDIYYVTLQVDIVSGYIYVLCYLPMDTVTMSASI